MPNGYLYHSPFDIYYIALVIPAVLFAMICQWRVSSTFKKYAKMKTRRGVTGEQAAKKVCSYGDAQGTLIKPIKGRLTDHFNPKTNEIGLSEGVYGDSSVAAVGVAAHEAGHASQYAQGYSPMRLRHMILPVTNIASMLAIPLVLLGIWMELFMLVNVGILLFGLAFVFQVVTLPVEFNASRRALSILESGGILDENELRGARKVLSAAAMTYVAAMAVSLAQLLRLLLISRGGGGRGGRL